jgi:hypothetical protein
MLAVAIEIIKMVGAIAGLLTMAFVAWCRWKEGKLTKELKLEDNPERCGRHEEAIVTLKGRFEKLEQENQRDHGEMLRQLAGLSLELVKVCKDIEKRS